MHALRGTDRQWMTLSPVMSLHTLPTYSWRAPELRVRSSNMNTNISQAASANPYIYTLTYRLFIGGTLDSYVIQTYTRYVQTCIRRNAVRVGQRLETFWLQSLSSTDIMLVVYTNDLVNGRRATVYRARPAARSVWGGGGGGVGGGGCWTLAWSSGWV